MWNDNSVIVTGAASGIGLALSRALVERGAQVWLADVDAEAVAEAAAKLGGKARANVLDVRDAPGFRALVEHVAEEHGRLGFLFNNAGIGVAGEAHELTVEHYDRALDVNVRGVTNGVAAALPIMVRQRSGHIVNTASAAGLVPSPLLAPYAMSKHAVVGLSLSLRQEVARHGVGVSALCPGPIETPLLDSKGPADLPPIWTPDARSFLGKVGGTPYPVDRLAADALRGVERNRGLIVAPASTRLGVLLYRLWPGLVLNRVRSLVAAELRERDEASP